MSNLVRNNADSIARHLRDQMGLKADDVVFMFSGIWGLGRLENGLQDITNAFKLVLPKGALIVPTFSYDWCEGRPWNPQTSSCQKVGAYPNFIYSDPDFERSNHPNYSVAALKNDHNRAIIEELFDIDDSTFGERSIFGNLLKMARKRRTFALLFGGAFSNAIFHCTISHHIHEKLSVPYRFHKEFKDPAGSDRVISQFSRYLSREEFIGVNRENPPDFLRFPVTESYTVLGEDLNNAKLLTRVPFGLHESRMISVDAFCDFFESKVRENQYYCVNL